MSSDTRELILARLRNKKRPTSTIPTPWRSRRDFADLAGRFSESLSAVKGQVLQAKNQAEAVNQLETLLYEELEAQKIAMNGEPVLLDMGLPERCPDLTWHIVGQTEGDLREFCATADVGLSTGDAALAETGSVLVSSGPGRSRLVTLLPPVHVAMVPTSILTPDIFTWTAHQKAETVKASANMTLISGPSKTADIEQTLAIGVHGPKRFIVILYADA